MSRFEASLLVSIILALVTQEKSPKLRRAVWTGVGSAAAASVLLGIGLVMTVRALHARIWCGNLCPMRLVTDAARTLADRPGLGKGNASSRAMRMGWLLPSTFVVVTFIVKGLPVQQRVGAGALFFILVVGIAAVVGFVFRRGTWCRYLCPIGGWLSRVTRLPNQKARNY